MSGEQGLPQAVDAGVRIVGLADEHARFISGEGVDLAIGDPTLLIPAHIDPTVNLHSLLHVWTGDGLTTWEVDGRRTD